MAQLKNTLPPFLVINNADRNFEFSVVDTVDMTIDANFRGCHAANLYALFLTFIYAKEVSNETKANVFAAIGAEDLMSAFSIYRP